MRTFDVIVVGSGVLGAFHAYFAGRRGLRTLLLERSDSPLGASVRNFGMIIPSGMPPGDWHRRAMEGAALYRDLAPRLGVPLFTTGTQYVATTPGEERVLEEFATLGPAKGYRCALLDAQTSVRLNAVLSPERCRVSLHFPDDLRLQSRVFFPRFLHYLQEQLGCEYRPRTVVAGVRMVQGADGKEIVVTTASGEEIGGRHVFLCPGSELRTLLPGYFATTGLIHCKLQMMRLTAPGNLRLGASLASGLTLRRYASFRLCPSWERLREETVDPESLRQGIHILLVQDQDGRLILGDSHEYGADDRTDTLDSTTERVILSEAQRFLQLPSWDVDERWHGVYTLHPEHELHRESWWGRLHVVTGIGGKGMTTGPGVARESIDSIA